MMEPGYIDITGVDARELVRAAYDLSRPQGLGFLQARDGGLDEDTIDEILSRKHIRMDYVHGRSVKLTALPRADGRLYIDSRWYDHTTAQLKELLARIGLDPSLVETAREARDAHYQACRDKALAALTSGPVKYDINGPGDEELELGLMFLKEDGRATEAFEYPVSTYTLVAHPDKDM